MIVKDATAFGAALREQRKSRGYTQAQVASIAGSSPQFLSALENGKETAELGRALRVAAVVGLDVALIPRDGSSR